MDPSKFVFACAVAACATSTLALIVAVVRYVRRPRSLDDVPTLVVRKKHRYRIDV